MSNINDPDGVIMEICRILLSGDDHVARIKPKLNFQQKSGKFYAVAEAIMFDSPSRTTMVKKLAVGEGRTVAKARNDLLKELMRRAQAIVDMPVRQIMES
jgi:hypothetical protein